MFSFIIFINADKKLKNINFKI